ncbi:hypothetical protein ACIF6L_34075 [Kitasatospora sp. NPDC086009]|uniref:hypothetical protein n=1 Tax=unclassified Kitasatospora TaxID=2633591 RepID=UPI0037CC121A
MGWLYGEGANASEGDNHEGWVIAVLTDGDAERDAFDETGEAYDRGLSWAWSFKFDGAGGRRKAQGLRAICSCGWRGPRRPADFGAPQACSEALRPEWERHCESALATTFTKRLDKLHQEMQDVLEALLDTGLPHGEPARPLLAAYAATILRAEAERYQQAAVDAARETHFSWDDIARALQMSKQSAHQRFTRNPVPVPADQH